MRATLRVLRGVGPRRQLAAALAAMFVFAGCRGGAQEVSPAELEKMQESAPAAPRVKPAAPRKLLVFNLCRGFKHSSIPYIAKAVEIMGKKTGAYEAVLTEDEEMFAPERLREFDAVLLNNNTGSGYFKDKRLAESFDAFVRGGKGLAGVHGATDGWFGGYLGGYFACHPWNEEVWVKLDDPFHELNRVFGGDSFKVADEIYVFREDETYSRTKLRILNSLDLNRTPDKGPRKDKDYPISWAARCGEGRIFYCSLGHRHELLWNPTILQFYLDGLQFVLGDLPADTEPSASRDERLKALAAKSDKASFDELAGLASSAEDADMRALALSALAKRGEKEAASIIAAGMKSENARVRGAAVNAYLALANALGEKGASAEAVKMFEDAAGYGAGARRAAMVGLGRFGTEQHLPQLVAALAEDDDETRGAALAGIAALARGEQAGRIAVDGLKALAPQRRAAALRALARYSDARATPLLIAFMADADEGVRIAAIETLGRVGDPSVAPMLAQAAASVAERQRAAARAALAALPEAEGVFAAGVADADEEPEIRAEYARALGARRARQFVESVTAALKTGDEKVRLACLAALVELLDPGQDATRAFWERTLESVENIEEKQIVLKGVGRMGNDWALEFLTQYFDESSIEDPALRPAALQACVEAAGLAAKKYPQQTKAALEQALNAAEDPALRKQIASLLESIK